MANNILVLLILMMTLIINQSLFHDFKSYYFQCHVTFTDTVCAPNTLKRTLVHTWKKHLNYGPALGIEFHPQTKKLE